MCRANGGLWFLHTMPRNRKPQWISKPVCFLAYLGGINVVSHQFSPKQLITTNRWLEGLNNQRQFIQQINGYSYLFLVTIKMTLLTFYDTNNKPFTLTAYLTKVQYQFCPHNFLLNPMSKFTHRNERCILNFGPEYIIPIFSIYYSQWDKNTGNIIYRLSTQEV